MQVVKMNLCMDGLGVSNLSSTNTTSSLSTK